MKIDKSNPMHWVVLAISGLFVWLSIVARWLLGPSRKNTVVLYGHKYSGNLRALADHCSAHHSDMPMYFLTLDGLYYKELRTAGIKVLSMTSLKDMVRVARSQVIITDHGLHTLVWYRAFTNIKFVDVWHGIPYKGFVPADLDFLYNHDEVWVSSPGIKKAYVEQFGFPADIVMPVGYARVDPLVNRSYSAKRLRKAYGIGDEFKKIVLVAPTWKQDDAGRSIFPFNETPARFLSELNRLAAAQECLVIFRAHLNTGGDVNIDNMSHVRVMSHHDYPQAEEFMFIADILVTDWSSMAFDYLALARPTIFLDVKPPFKNGFTVGPEYRFGEVVDSLDSLALALRTYLRDPELFNKKYARIMQQTEALVYGDTLDGKVCERSYQRLKNLLKTTF